MLTPSLMNVISIVLLTQNKLLKVKSSLKCFYILSIRRLDLQDIPKIKPLKVSLVFTDNIHAKKVDLLDMQFRNSHKSQRKKEQNMLDMT